MFTRFHVRLRWIAALPTPLRAGPLWARCLGAALLTVLSIDTAGATPNPIAGRIVSPGALAVGPLSSQAPETILYAFKGIPDGSIPQGGLVADKDGSLYGTTQAGGLNFQEENLGAGTVFKLTPRRSGGYTESIIYRFGASGADDAFFPQAGGLTVDPKGALYGATYLGGLLKGSLDDGGFGTIFKLTPTAKGYTETIPYKFRGLRDGANPSAPPIFDQSGALYGTTQYSVYKLTPTSSGYRFSTLYSGGSGSAANYIYGGLALDQRTGDLFGTALLGGVHHGLVFKLHPTASGYVYTILHSFQGPDGSSPIAGLLMDRAGALYGTTPQGGLASGHCYDLVAGVGGCGVVFKLTPSHGGYAYSVLHNFTGGVDGAVPTSPLIADSSGTLYSTTSCGGLAEFTGTVFKLVPTRTGYQLVTLHEFNYNTDGGQFVGFDEGLLLSGDYLLGEQPGPFVEGFYSLHEPYDNGSIYALKIH